MAPKRRVGPKKLVLKKQSVIRDDLKLDGKGCYAFLLYSNIDRHGKTVYKIGQTTTSFAKRNENYHTYVGPNGVYIMALLRSPTRLRPRDSTITQYYETVENYIFQQVFEQGGQYIWSTTRVKLDGRTEFVYCSAEVLHEAFRRAQSLYGGQLTLFNDQNINAESAYQKAHFPTFTAESLFPLKNQPSVKRARVGFHDD